MGIAARLVVLLPLALSIVGIVLSSLCLFAGRDRDFMEDYDIVRLNTSKLGQDLIPWDEIDTSSIIDDITDNWKRDIKDDIKDNINDAKDDAKDSLNDAKDDAKDSLNDAKDDVKGSIDDAKDKAGDVKDDIKDDVNNAKDDAKNKLDEVEEDLKDKGSDLTNEVIDRVTDRLGISDWYSLHVMSACEGYYEPNATEHDPSLNVTGCSTDSPTYRLNLTDMLDKELELGDLGINLSDINWPSEIQDKLDLINDLLLAIFIVYVIGMGFCGLAVLGCIGSLIFASSRAMVLINFILSFLGALALTVGSIVVTVAGTKGIDEFNNVANDVGVSASRGKEFLIISWVASGCMIFAAAFWTFRFCVLCAQRRKDRKVVAHKGDYYEKGGYSRKSNWGNSKSGRKWGRAFGGVGHGVGDGVGHGAGDGSS